MITSAPAATTMKQFTKPPCACKTPQVDMIFAKQDFPPLTLASTSSSATATTTSIPHQAQPPPLTPLAAAYDYRAELDRITAEIKNNLKPEFDNLFAQLESQITNLAEQQTQQHAEQAKQYAEQQAVNAQNAQQLAWVVDNMKKFFQYAYPNLPFMSPSLQSDGRV